MFLPCSRHRMTYLATMGDVDAKDVSPERQSLTVAVEILVPRHIDLQTGLPGSQSSKVELSRIHCESQCQVQGTRHQSPMVSASTMVSTSQQVDTIRR